MERNAPHILHVYNVRYIPCEDGFATDDEGNLVSGDDGLPVTVKVPQTTDDGEPIVLDAEVTLAFPEDSNRDPKSNRSIHEAFMRAVKLERREHPDTRTFFEQGDVKLLRSKIIHPKVATA